jgi:hypothetical protein
MAGRALPRDLGWGGVVGLVAGDACAPGVVLGFNDLGKAGGPGREVAMTVETVVPLDRQYRQANAGILRVIVGGAVADFTGKRAMVGSGLYLTLLHMTHDAGFPAGVFDAEAGGRVDCVGSVGSEFTI